MTAQAMAGYVMEKPGRNSALVLCTVMSVLIVLNAAWWQANNHPAPLFQTRVPGGQLAELLSRDVRTVQGDRDLRYPPLVADRALVSEVQSMLAVRGYYRGVVDGIDGPETRAAIAAYEREVGLEPTGEPSSRLIAKMRMSQIITDDVVVPQRAPATSGGTIGDLATSSDPLAVLIQLDSPLPRAKPGHAQNIEQNGGISAARVQDVQNALNSFGYGPIEADGVFGQNTATAIQRFEEQQGLTPTGDINDELIMRLITIGALAQ